MKLTFELTTPERIVEKKEVDGVTLPTQEGEITVLPGHIPLVSNLKPGVVTLHDGKEQEYLSVSGGFIEVQPDGRLIVLADTAAGKRLKEDARQSRKLIDATHGRKTRSIIVTDSDHVVLSSVHAETLISRLKNRDGRDEDRGKAARQEGLHELSRYQSQEGHQVQEV